MKGVRATVALIMALGAGAPAGAADLPRWQAQFPEPDMARVELGRLLYFDPVLSGSRTVSCATCHHPRFATSDGVSLGIGDGGIGLGPDRRPDPANYPEQRVPRNAQALFNLGAAEFTRFFHDGRLETDPSRPSGIRSPLEDSMAVGFSSVLSAQSMFPVLSPDEMAGHYSENDVSRAVRLGFLSLEGGAWDIIAARVAAIPEYRQRFDGLIGPDAPIHFTDISDVIADFIMFEFRADDSLFDRFLKAEETLGATAMAGLDLFYGKAGCSACHAGLYQTDHDFHAIAMPQIGPGKAERFETHNRDLGRMRVTGQESDAYRFRTPSLRNVTATAPYGHDGAYARLEDMLRHHLDPVASLYAYQPEMAILPAMDVTSDWNILSQPEEIAAIAAANELAPVALGEDEIAALMAFLETLTDAASLKGRLGIPQTVPSGLPVDQ